LKYTLIPIGDINGIKNAIATAPISVAIVVDFYFINYKSGILDKKLCKSD
jgi:hypothetical protein